MPQKTPNPAAITTAWVIILLDRAARPEAIAASAVGEIRWHRSVYTTLFYEKLSGHQEIPAVSRPTATILSESTITPMRTGVKRNISMARMANWLAAMCWVMNWPESPLIDLI